MLVCIFFHLVVIYLVRNYGSASTGALYLSLPSAAAQRQYNFCGRAHNFGWAGTPHDVRADDDGLDLIEHTLTLTLTHANQRNKL